MNAALRGQCADTPWSWFRSFLIGNKVTAILTDWTKDVQKNLIVRSWLVKGHRAQFVAPRFASSSFSAFCIVFSLFLQGEKTIRKPGRQEKMRLLVYSAIDPNGVRLAGDMQTEGF
jgi:hypothetical protein